MGNLVISIYPTNIVLKGLDWVTEAEDSRHNLTHAEK